MADELQRKRIGIDIRLWNQTGIGRYIRNLVLGLLNIDNQNQYVLFGRDQDLESIKHQVSNSKYGQDAILIQTNANWHSVAEQLEFPRLLNKYKLDLMHFPYFSVPVFYKRPFVVTVHDLIINKFPTGKASTLPLPFYKIKRAGYEFVLKKAILNARKIIVPSRATKDEIIKEYKTKKEKIVVTTEGIDDEISNFTPVLFNKKNPYFLYVGNAYPHKNLERFLEAFKLYRGQESELTVKLVGREDYFYKRLKEFTKKEKIENVEFLGYVPDNMLSKLYAQASATFVPSLMEGFGLTALEAMKMGTIAAVSGIPSLTEVCTEHAVYFDPGDTLSITSAMREITSMKDEERKKRIASAEKYAEKFTWEKMAKETLEIYNTAIEMGRN